MKAYQIMEEIINEVSIGKWKEAAASSLPKRQEEAEAAKKAVEQGWEEYDKQARKHPEEEPALFRLAQANDEAGVKAEDRAEHAKDVAGIKVNDKVGANKAIKAAKKVSAKREDDFGRAPSARTLKRSAIANRLVYADPKYKNEALEIMEAIINEVSNEWKKRAQDKADMNVKNAELDLENKKTAYQLGMVDKKTLNDAMLNVQKHVGRAAKLDNAIIKHEKAKMEGRIKPVKEALEIMEAILDAVTPIFELDYENRQNVNTNKIRKLKKDKDGENVEVVSVADELFPYEGNAKQQFNQKVLAKINDMIEGKGSLEDLIQFVRKYSGNRKVANESTEISEEGKEPNKECEYRKAEWEKASNNYFETKKKHLDWEGKHPETKKAYEEERKAYANLDKARRDSKKINGPYEALEEIKQVVEGLFVNDGRGDLLNDIDNALGSPVKKTVKDMVKQCTGCKQKKVK